jgi:hypothetical protein
MSYDPEVMDSYLTAQNLLSRQDTMKLGKVVCQIPDKHNFHKGKANNNPILDTPEYVGGRV